MRINSVNLTNYKNNLTPVISVQKSKNTSCTKPNGLKSSLECISNYNLSNISFQRKFENHPAKKLFWISTGEDKIEKDKLTDDMAWRVETSIGQKSWSTVPPRELLKRTAGDAIRSICTLNNTYEIPDYIGTPNYGDNWGRRANYIEVNPRLIARTKGYKVSEGLLNTIKILPAIPPSTKNIPMCLILSQFFPTYGSYHDGYTGDIGVYCLDFNNGVAKNLTSNNLKLGHYNLTDTELVRAFNDLSHFRGLKTGVRMPISAGQMTIRKKPFDWHNEQDLNTYIDQCKWLIDLGFDCIYFDSGKHIGWYDMEHYCGCGDVPDYPTMQYITQQIRQRSGRGDISFVAEKTNLDPRFENAGYTAGTDWGVADDKDNLWYEYHNQEWNSNYAAGPIISDDNDDGSMSYEQRLTRLQNAFSTFDDSYKKLPVHMQMHDLFPLSEYLNTHQTMMESQNRATSDDVNSHYNNVFSSSEAAFNQTMNMYKEFEKIMDR